MVCAHICVFSMSKRTMIALLLWYLGVHFVSYPYLPPQPHRSDQQVGRFVLLFLDRGHIYLSDGTHLQQQGIHECSCIRGHTARGQPCAHVFSLVYHLTVLIPIGRQIKNSETSPFWDPFSCSTWLIMLMRFRMCVLALDLAHFCAC